MSGKQGNAKFLKFLCKVPVIFETHKHSLSKIFQRFLDAKKKHKICTKKTLKERKITRFGLDNAASIHFIQ